MALKTDLALYKDGATGDMYYRSATGLLVPITMTTGQVPTKQADGTVIGVTPSSGSSGGGTATAITAKDWRIYCTATQGGGLLALSNIEFRSTLGVTLQATGGTASASSVNATGLEADKAFDATASTFAATVNTSGPHWYRYSFAAAVPVSQIAITNRADSGGSGAAPVQSLKDWSAQYSTDGGTTWVDVFQVWGEAAWAFAQQRLYTLPVVGSASGTISGIVPGTAITPTIVQSGVLCTSNGAGTITLPAAPTIGNILVAIGARWAGSIATDAGWTRLVDQASGALDVGVIFWRTVTAAVAAQTFSSSVTGWEMAMYEIAGASPATFYAYGAVATLASSTSLGFSAGVPAAGCMALGMFMEQGGASTITLGAGPTADGTGADASSSNGGARSMAAFHQAITAAGAWSPTATLSVARQGGYAYFVIGGALVGSSSGSTAPTVIQSAYARTNGGGTIALATTPTVGTYMILMNAGYSGGVDIPVGWNSIVFASNGSNGAPGAQRFWAAWKKVVTGETGSVTYTSGGDWNNLALINIDDLNYADGIVGNLSTSGNNFSIGVLRPTFGGALRLVFIEHDIGQTLAFTSVGTATLQTYGASSNHYAVLGSFPSTFTGALTGTSTSGFTFPGYMLVNLGK